MVYRIRYKRMRKATQEKRKEGNKMNVEMKLNAIDFSRFSKVRGSLKTRLMSQYKTELSLDDLDLVAAAGRNNLGKAQDTGKNEI